MRGMSLRARFRAILSLNDTPHRIALAISLGIFVAFTPTLGLHTVSALALAWLFRVSKAVTLAATLVNNPWTLVPVYGTCLWFGTVLTGRTLDVPAVVWADLGPTTVWAALKDFVVPFVAGTMVLGTVAAVSAYLLSRWAIRRYRAPKARTAMTPDEGAP